MFKSKKKTQDVKSSSSHIIPNNSKSPGHLGSSSSSTKKFESGTPFISEKFIGQALEKRTELMLHHENTLGPPDLVHLSSHTGSKEYSQYHFVTGLDVSSIAAPVAYLTKLVFNDHYNSNGASGSSSSNWSSIGTYRCWNSFSKCDIRIKVEFPGQATNVQLIGINGKPFHIRRAGASNTNSAAASASNSNITSPNFRQSLPGSTLPTPILRQAEGVPMELWQQTYVSCIMRNILFSDDLKYMKPALIQNTMLSTKSSAKKIIELVVRMLPKGFLTGCSDLHSSPDFINNYLIDTLIRILKISDLYDFTISKIELYIQYNFHYHLVLTLVLLQQNTQEIRIIKELKKGIDYYTSIKQLGLHNSSNELTAKGGNSVLHFKKGKNYLDFYLLQQSKLMTEKYQFDSALYLATRAIEENPTEFLNWTNLLETYITKQDIKNALLTLNSCPVYSLSSTDAIKRIREENALIDKDLGNVKFPEPLKEGYLEEVWSIANKFGPVYLKNDDTLLSEEFVSDAELKTVDPVFLKLSGPKLKGTFKQAYNYLSSLAILVGWDKLLKYRAEVFVMDGEFKSENSASPSVESVDKSNDADSSSSSEMLETARLKANKFKKKRLCERWLDSLFFMLYDDLKVVNIWEVEARKTGNSMTHSTLEWELIGITAFRAKHYDLAISALRTCLKAKFSIICAKNLLEIFEQFFQNYSFFKRLNVNFENNKYCKELLLVGLDNILFPQKKEFILDKSLSQRIPIKKQLEDINEQSLEGNLYLDLILDVLIKIFSWNYRWYEDFSIDCLIFLKDVLKENEKDLIINKLIANYSQDGNAVRLLQRYISWIEMFNDE